MDKITASTDLLPALQVSPVERAAPVRGGATADASSQQEQAVSQAPVALATAVEQINDFIQIARRDLVFSVDERTGQTVVSVVDAQTQEVIRQIPSEEVLAIAARLDEARGLLFEDKA